ncbi:MAG: hypothetical protein LBM98_05710 [Oscillospiraceae bacterium]|jgi:hypothetical protein|nr:hypothetical protein [Oscillospiraceae bacterium]
MTVFEANDRLKTPILEEELWQLNPAYLLLDLDKDDFCKIVNAVGKDKFIGKQSWFERLFKAEEELKAKERYIAAQQKLLDLKTEERQLKEYVEHYQKEQRKLVVYGETVNPQD